MIRIRGSWGRSIRHLGVERGTTGSYDPTFWGDSSEVFGVGETMGEATQKAGNDGL